LDKTAPLFEALAKHANSQAASFHVPGHKFGMGLEGRAAQYLAGAMSIDATEIAGLDDLHHPEGVIRKAQDMAAACFGAEETFFLVGGSTVGNLALLTSICNRGDIILVQRNVHKSVLNGLILAGAQAVFLTPTVDRHSGIAAGVQAPDIELALDRYPQAKALFLVNPNYYGMGIDLRPIADLVHSRGVPLLVDEAHGAHYGFHPALPKSALSSGADAVVQSTHKMLSAMTMGAMLHVQGGLIDRDTLKQRLAMLQSSSPSYPIMASLDLARLELEQSGKRLLGNGLEVVNYFRSRLERTGRFRILIQQEDSAYQTLDPFKLTIADEAGVLSGPQLAAKLERGGCFPEMSDPLHVLLLFTLHSSHMDADRAIAALEAISDENGLRKQEKAPSAANRRDMPPFLPLSAPVSFALSPVRPFSQQHPPSMIAKPILGAVGMYAAEMIIPYPPGIPALFPGERISLETARSLDAYIRAGVKFQGSRLAENGTIYVYAGGAQ